MDLENVKYIVFDIGGVFLGPTTGHWFITPYIQDTLRNEIDMEQFKLALKNNYSLVNEISLQTEEEEYLMFYNYYKKALLDIHYNGISDELLSNMSKSITWGNDRYTFYKDVIPCLEKLSKQYTLVILSDNFPSINRILKDKGIDKYFDSIIISTFYGCRKKDRVLFDILRETIHYEDLNAIFVDDSENNLDIAKEYNLVSIRMDREIEAVSKYPIIHSLVDLKEKRITRK